MVEVEYIKGFEGIEIRLKALANDLSKGIVRHAIERALKFLQRRVQDRIRSMFTRRTGGLEFSVDTSVELDRLRNGASIVRGKVISRTPKRGAPYNMFWVLGFQHVGRSKSAGRSLHRTRAFGKRHGIDVSEAVAKHGKFMQRDFMTPVVKEDLRTAGRMVADTLRAGFDQAARESAGAGEEAA